MSDLTKQPLRILDEMAEEWANRIKLLECIYSIELRYGREQDVVDCLKKMISISDFCKQSFIEGAYRMYLKLKEEAVE